MKLSPAPPRYAPRAIAPNPFPFVPRHIRRYNQTGLNNTANSNYGWSEGSVNWNYSPPPYPSSSDITGWHSFSCAEVFKLGREHGNSGYMAVSFGCHWDEGERAWAPEARHCNTLDEAMDFCEKHLAEKGVFPVEWLPR